MRIGLILHLCAMALTLALALSTWKAPDEKRSAAEDQTLIDGTLDDLSRVAFKTATSSVVVTPQGSGGARTWAVELVRSVKDRADSKDGKDSGGPDAGVFADGGTAEPPAKPRRFVFPAGRSVTRSLDKLAPFSVKRTITDVPVERLEAMELDGEVGSLEVTLKGTTLSFDVGGKTYGGGARYLRDKTGAVYLVASAALRGLEGTETRLAERRIVPLDVDEITQILLKSGERSGSFVHQEREQPKKRFFAAEGKPEERSDEAGAVIADLRRLRAKAWLLPEEVDLEGRTLQVEFVIQRHEAGEMAGKLFSAKEGTALVQVGPWSASVTEGMAKGLVDDVMAALP